MLVPFTLAQIFILLTYCKIRVLLPLLQGSLPALPWEAKLLGRSPFGQLGLHWSHPPPPQGLCPAHLTSQYSFVEGILGGDKQFLLPSYFSNSSQPALYGFTFTRPQFLIFLFSPFRYHFHFVKNIFLPPMTSFNLPFNQVWLDLVFFF